MITEQAQQVCSKHYGGWQAKANGCGHCPIQSQCITHKPTHTEPELAAWRASINEAAEKWLQEQEMQR